MSLSACFEKKERLVWESGKGVWWTVNESVEGGSFGDTDNVAADLYYNCRDQEGAQT